MCMYNTCAQSHGLEELTRPVGGGIPGVGARRRPTRIYVSARRRKRAVRTSCRNNTCFEKILNAFCI